MRNSGLCDTVPGLNIKGRDRKCLFNNIHRYRCFSWEVCLKENKLNWLAVTLYDCILNDEKYIYMDILLNSLMRTVLEEFFEVWSDVCVTLGGLCWRSSLSMNFPWCDYANPFILLKIKIATNHVGIKGLNSSRICTPCSIDTQNILILNKEEDELIFLHLGTRAVL